MNSVLEDSCSPLFDSFQLSYSFEMKFLRKVKWRTRGNRIGNKEIKHELKALNLNEGIKEKKRKWSEHIKIMKEHRSQLKAIKC